MKINNIQRKKLSESQIVYDIQVSGNSPTFVCQGVVVHNSDICRHNDGRTWFYDFPEKSTLQYEETPPAHRNCRSITVPITKSWRELGLDIDEFPPGTRASISGQVPAKLTYTEWFNDLEKYSDQANKIRLDILGPVRYDLWKKNDLRYEDLFARDGRILNLVELQDRDYAIATTYRHYLQEGK